MTLNLRTGHSPTARNIRLPRPRVTPFSVTREVWWSAADEVRLRECGQRSAVDEVRSTKYDRCLTKAERGMFHLIGFTH